MTRRDFVRAMMAAPLPYLLAKYGWPEPVAVKKAEMWLTVAVLDDGSVVVLYSNGRRDETYYEDGYIELAEYDNVRVKMVVLEDKNLIQSSDAGEGAGFAKRWRQIDTSSTSNPFAPSWKIWTPALTAGGSDWRLRGTRSQS